MNIRFESTPLAPPPALDTIPPHRDGQVAIGTLHEAFLAPGPAADGLRALLSGAPCVTTGQQAGLLGGPLYTVYKAASAVALARRLSARRGSPVVPVFWVAGDDHDFAEVNHLVHGDRGGAVATVRLRERSPDAPLVPMYQEVLGPDIAAVLAAVREAVPETEFRDAVLEAVATAYTPERTVAGAFAELLAAWFGPQGLVVFRPTHAAAKRAMAPVLVRALEDAAHLNQQLQARADALVRNGQSVPVPVDGEATLVMLEGAAGRDRLMRDGDGFSLRRSGERMRLTDLRRIAEAEPQRLSPNVLLRPAVEAALLPTVAYIGGPGELAYFPQATPVYDALEISPQTPVPRWSARLIEARVQKVLDKYRVSADDLHLAEGQLEARLVRDEMPAEAVAALGRLRATVTEDFERLREAAVSVDATLRKPVESQRGQVLSGLADIEKRLVHHLKQQNEILVTQLDKARAALWPLGQPQERVVNVVGLLVRYGPELLNDMVDEAHRWYGTD